MAFCPNGGLPVSMPSTGGGPNVGPVGGMNSSQGLPGPPNQQFCLKWNNHTINMVKTFTEMIAGESFTDVTLACDGHIIKAHKIVLSACSNYFREIFLATPCKHPVVVLKDMKIDELKAIIDFMYRGEVNVSQNQLGNLLKTAEVLRVKGLTEVNEADGLKPDHQEVPQEEQIMMNGNIGQPVMHHSSPMKNGVFPHGVVHQEIISNVAPMIPFIQQQPQAIPAAVPTATAPKRAKPNKRKSTANPRRTRTPSTNTSNAVAVTSSSTVSTMASSPVKVPSSPSGVPNVIPQVVQPPPGIVLPPTSTGHHIQQHKDLEEEQEVLHAANSIATLHHQTEADVDSVEGEVGEESIDVTEARARMAVNSYGSVASTSSSTSPPPSSSQTYPHEASTPDGIPSNQRSMKRVIGQQSSSGQREVMSTDTSLADGMSNDVSIFLEIDIDLN